MVCLGESHGDHHYIDAKNTQNPKMAASVCKDFCNEIWEFSISVCLKFFCVKGHQILH